MLSEAGIPPMDLLAEATLNGAPAMGREHGVGTVTPHPSAPVTLVRHPRAP